MKIEETFELKENPLLGYFIGHIFGEEFEDGAKAKDLQEFFKVEIPDDCEYIFVKNNQNHQEGLNFEINYMGNTKSSGPNILITKLRIQVDIDSNECKFFKN